MTTSPEPAIRAFIAADPGEAVRDGLLRVQRGLRKTLDSCPMKISWAGPDTMHLTLLFFGGISAAQAAAMQQAMERIAGGIPPMELALDDVPDVFGRPDRPRVLWAGVRAPPAFFDLQARLAGAARDSGIETEERPFHPHFTLARIRHGRPDELFFRALEHARVEPLRFTVAAVHLIQSEPAANGFRHVRLGSAALKPPT